MLKGIMIGRLGKDPELRYTPQGTAICDFSLASDSKQQDGTKVTQWVRVTIFGKQAETIAEHLKKGREVYVEGSLSLSEWTDRDGNKKTTLELKASDVQFLGGKTDQPPARVDSSKAGPDVIPPDDDLPF